MNTLYAGQPTYIDWSVVNDGSATASGRFYSCLYLDGSEVGRWYTDNLAANSYTYVSDSSLTVGTAGNHTLKLVTDCTSVIGESNESDNTWERTFTWLANPNAKPNLRPYQPSGWDYPIVPSSIKGTNKVNALYTGQPTYIDWSVVNDGTATASGRLYNCLYLDGSEVGRWYVDNLGANYYTYISDWSLTVATAGNHTLKLVVDCTSAIGESNESDNSWERSFTWNDGNADTDGDALLDRWETVGYDDNNDGIVDVNLPALGANPQRKDLFVEVDWMADQAHSHRPTDFAINRIVVAFAAAPVTNPSGGINLHVDLGQLGGGNVITHQNNLTSWAAFDTIKNINFNLVRRRIFRYALFAHQYDFGQGACSSGIARGIPSSDFLVTLGCVGVGTEDQQSGTFMHELGHTLGLHHGGNDDIHYKPNYLSVMNYRFQFSGLRMNSSWSHYDYSRFALPTLNENSLNERIGLNGGTAITSYGTSWSCPDHVTIPTSDTPNGPIDWNCNNVSTETAVSADITYGPNDTSGSRNTLNSRNDWATLSYRGGSVGTTSLQQELTALQEAQPIFEEASIQELERADPSKQPVIEP